MDRKFELIKLSFTVVLYCSCHGVLTDPARILAINKHNLKKNLIFFPLKRSKLHALLIHLWPIHLFIIHTNTYLDNHST